MDAGFAHVGDSRAYLLRAGDLRQLTDDHTLVARMVQLRRDLRGRGRGPPAPQRAHARARHRSRVAVDEFDVALTDGDRLLLCSDGLTGMVTEEQIVAILSAAPDPQDAANRLVRAANRAGGIDNITVVVLDVEAEAARGRRRCGDGLAVRAARRPQEATAEPRRAGSRWGSLILAVAADRRSRVPRPAVVRRRVRRPRRRVPGHPGERRRARAQPCRRDHRHPRRRRAGDLLLLRPRGRPHGERPGRRARRSSSRSAGTWRRRGGASRPARGARRT